MERESSEKVENDNELNNNWNTGEQMYTPSKIKQHRSEQKNELIDLKVD